MAHTVGGHHRYLSRNSPRHRKGSCSSQRRLPCLCPIASKWSLQFPPRIWSSRNKLCLSPSCPIVPSAGVSDAPKGLAAGQPADCRLLAPPHLRSLTRGVKLSMTVAWHTNSLGLVCCRTAKRKATEHVDPSQLRSKYRQCLCVWKPHLL